LAECIYLCVVAKKLCNSIRQVTLRSSAVGFAPFKILTCAVSILSSPIIQLFTTTQNILRHSFTHSFINSVTAVVCGFDSPHISIGRRRSDWQLGLHCVAVGFTPLSYGAWQPG